MPHRALFATARWTPHLMLRGPQVFHSPSEGPDPEPQDDTPEEFREQPGDREPEPDADPAPDSEPEPEGDDDAEPELEPEPEEEAEPDADEPQPETQGKKDWKDRQIAKLREKEAKREQELADAKRRAEAAEALLAATPEARSEGLEERERERIRNEEAQKLTEADRYKRINTGLEAMDEAGKAAFGDAWEQRVALVREAMSEELIKRPDFLEAVTDLPNAAAVYHELGEDPDRIEKLLAMPPHKMGMELARMSDRLAKPKPKPISKAPAPIRPIERGGVERDLDDLINDPNASMEEIDRRMRAEEKKRAGAR